MHDRVIDRSSKEVVYPTIKNDREINELVSQRANATRFDKANVTSRLLPAYRDFLLADTASFSPHLDRVSDDGVDQADLGACNHAHTLRFACPRSAGANVHFSRR